MSQPVALATDPLQRGPALPGHLDITSPDAYARPESLLAAYRELRETTPVCWVDREPYRPFWAVTRHADILAVEKANELFINAPRLTLLPKVVEERSMAARPGPLESIRMLFALLRHSNQKWSDFQSLRRTNAAAEDSRESQVRTVIHLDEPEHRKYRHLTHEWFMGRGVQRVEQRVRELANRAVDDMARRGNDCDFAADIANWYPLQVIMSILGLPIEDAPRLLKWSQQLLSASDPELQKSDQYGSDVMLEMYAYFSKLIAERRKKPTDDLASVIVHSQVDDRPIELVDMLSYFLIVATAGHETTSAAIAGGMLALIENPDELIKLQADPSLARTAADEIVRWVTPVRHFTRTATADASVGEVAVAKGESLAIFYLSANRDPDAFEKPDRFRVDRDNNRHLGFGHGVHHCLGRMLALMEIRSMLAELAPRLQQVELAGDPQWIASNFTGGVKHLPIRYQVG